MHRMKKKIKDELEDRNTIQEYICPNCKRRCEISAVLNNYVFKQACGDEVFPFLSDILL